MIVQVTQELIDRLGHTEAECEDTVADGTGKQHLAVSVGDGQWLRTGIHGGASPVTGQAAWVVISTSGGS